MPYWHDNLQAWSIPGLTRQGNEPLWGAYRYFGDDTFYFDHWEDVEHILQRLK